MKRADFGPGLNASDLIVAQNVLEENQYRVDLVFRHALHRLRIELTAEDDLGMDVLVRSRIGGIVDLLTGEASVTDDTFEWIKPAKCKDGSFEAVIYPQPAAPYRDGDGMLLKLTVQGKEYAFKAPEKQTDGSTLNTFEAENNSRLNSRSNNPETRNGLTGKSGCTASRRQQKRRGNVCSRKSPRSITWHGKTRTGGMIATN